MGYFIHNKYDKTSVAKLSSMKAAGHTVIDYYGLLESGDTTYKYLDTKDMPCVVSTLSYVNINKNGFVSNTKPEDENCQFNFSSSIIIKSIQRGIGGVTNITSASENGSTVYKGTINIAPIDPNKSIVIFYDGSIGRYGGGHNPAILNLSKTTIEIEQFYSSFSNYISWQVVEFK